MEIIGRNKEITQLNELYNSKKAEFVVVYGHRPLNQYPQYKVIDVEEEDGEVRIIATLKRVL